VPRRIGLDVHREFAQIAVWEDGLVRQAGQIATTPEALRAFADSLLSSDEVAIEATCNTHAIVKLIAPRVARVVVSNPMKTRAIAEAQVKTDKVDAKILAQLLAADYLPAVWIADERTQALRRQVARRAHIVRQRTRLKNQVQAILHRNLVPKPLTCSGSRAAAGWRTSRCRPTRSSRSRRCCASLTSTVRSCGSSTPRSLGTGWGARRSSG
jgi:transposase